jgi:AcrR family transcriptional regulator
MPKHGKDAEEGVNMPRLHGGRHRIPPDVVAFQQRERLLSAIVQVVAERGYNDATIGQITAVAAISRRTFYEHFKSKEEGFQAAFDIVLEHIFEIVAGALEAQDEWADQVAAALVALLAFLAAEPAMARFTLLASVAAGEPMVSRRQEVVARFTAMLRVGRPQRVNDRPLPESIEEAVVGGIVTLLGRRVAAGQAAELDRLTPDVIEFALAPYLAFEEAERVAERHAKAKT